MRLLSTLLSAALIAGCASYMPKEVVEQGVRTDQPSALTSRQAAHCLARNGQNITDLYWAAVNDLPTLDTFEVVFNVPRYPQTGAIMVMHTRPEKNGSVITFHASPRLSESAKMMWIEKLGKDC